MKSKYALLIIIVLFVILFLSFLLISELPFSERNWWTKVFCGYEGGDYIDKKLIDVCILGDNVYVAKFTGTGEHYNVTEYGEKKEWQLTKLKENKTWQTHG